jgi:predicted Zn-dependent protease
MIRRIFFAFIKCPNVYTPFQLKRDRVAFLSTHPSNASRIENLKELQKKVEGIYLRSPQYGLGEQI